MNEYLKWKEETIKDFSLENIDAMYDRGFVFTRIGKGVMQQTRSIRIDLSKFELSSENRRILRKTDGLDLTINDLPFTHYEWTIGKMGKDFYEKKFGDGTFSANKIKELLTDNREDFNRVLVYALPLGKGEQEGVDGNTEDLATTNQPPLTPPFQGGEQSIGYCIAVETNNIFHYSYPFYNLDADKNTGMSMMIRAIAHAKEANKKYIYLGSFQRPGDTYKLQFSGMQWFDGEKWQSDLEELKSFAK